MRQEMVMRSYDIGGKRVNEVKLTVKCGDDKVGHCMINLADEQELSQFKEHHLVDDDGRVLTTARDPLCGGARVKLQVIRKHSNPGSSATMTSSRPSPRGPRAPSAPAAHTSAARSSAPPPPDAPGQTPRDLTGADKFDDWDDSDEESASTEHRTTSVRSG